MIAGAGEGVRFSTPEDFYPGAQIALVYYGEKFASGKTDAGRRFMKAYVRAVRDYNDSIVDGKFGESANAREIIAMLVKGLGMSEATIRGFSAPTGSPTMSSMDCRGIPKDSKIRPNTAMSK